MEPIIPRWALVICRSHLAAGKIYEYPTGSIIQDIKNRAKTKLYFILYHPRPVTTKVRSYIHMLKKILRR